MQQLIFLALVLAQPPVPTSPPAVPTLPPSVPMAKEQQQQQPPIVIDEQKPYVVFVGVPVSKVAGVPVVRDDSYDISRGIYLVMPGDQWHRIHDVSDVAYELRRLGVGRSASFFDRSSNSNNNVDRRQQTVEGNPWLAVSEQDELLKMWPKNISSDGFRFYRQTRKSQRIAITGSTPTNQWYDRDRDDVWANAPTSFNPNRTDERWMAPGGLARIGGWRSFTAVYLPDSVRTWVQPLPIANGGIIPGGRRWAYPDGTVFADLLTKDGQPFELRMREKSDGRWDSFVAWKDREAAPVGYHGAGRRCSECHNLAGTSEQYGILVRGADTVFSFNPFD